MIDYNNELVSALKTVLPTHYEMALKSKKQTPCISYQERSNYATDTGDTLGYSRIAYTIKVWGNEIGVLNKYAQEIDNVLRPIGFKRTNSGELADPSSTMIQKILTYEAIGLENFN